MAGSPPLPNGLPIGRRLKMRRDALGMSAREVASLAGITASQLSRIEHGRHSPTWETVERLYWVMGITLREKVIDDEAA